MTCPECGGPWLYHLTFKHVVGCSLYARDDATRNNDHEHGYGIRLATPTERTLIDAIGGYELPGDEEHYWIDYDCAAIHGRAVRIGRADATYRQLRDAKPGDDGDG